MTTTVNRDPTFPTEDYDHVSKVTPISLKKTEYFQPFARDPYMPTLTITTKKLNEAMATAVQYGMPFISTDAEPQRSGPPYSAVRVQCLYYSVDSGVRPESSTIPSLFILSDIYFICLFRSALSILSIDI